MTSAVAPAKVGLKSRLIDAGSMALVLCGAALYVRAYFGMQALRDRAETPFERGSTEAFAALREFTLMHRMSIAGLVIAGAGVLVGVWAAVHAHRSRRVEMIAAD